MSINSLSILVEKNTQALNNIPTDIIPKKSIHFFVEISLRLK